MARNAVAWIKLDCCGAEIAFKDHWAGLVEVVCGESRVMVCYNGRERLSKLPPEVCVSELKSLLEAARAERRNRASAELLAAYLERTVHPATALDSEGVDAGENGLDR